MSDVVVTVGANATPFQQAMSQVQATAKQTGKTLGVELGDKGGFREEMRFERGLHGLVQNLSAAKDPAQALGSVIEGLGRSFRITGGVMVAFAIGDYIREQLTTAAESASNFQDKFQAAFSVDVVGQSSFQLHEVRKNLEDLEKDYEKRGLLRRLIFGKGEDQTIVGVREKLAEVAAAADASAAQLTRDDTAAMTSDIFAKAAAEKNKIEDEYKGKVNAAREAGEVDNAKALEEQKAAKILEVNRKLGEELDKQRTARETAADEKHKRSVEEKHAIEDLQSHRQELLDQASGIGNTDAKRIEALQAQVDLHLQLKNTATDVKSGLEEENNALEAGNKLASLRSEILGKQVDEMAKAIDNSKEVNALQAELSVRQIDAMGFHGQVSSLRRSGFAGGIGPNQNSDQLKAVNETNKKLDHAIMLWTAMAAKFGGAF